MNWAYFHLALNHIPVLVLPAGLLLVGAGVLRKSSELQKAGLAALVLGALVALPVYFTGEPAEERIEHLAGVDEELIEEHEEAALSTVIAAAAAGLIALAGLFIFRKAPSIPTGLLAGCAVVSLIASALLVNTAMLGGEIRHPEIRSGLSAPAGGDEEHEGHEEHEESEEAEEFESR